MANNLRDTVDGINEKGWERAMRSVPRTRCLAQEWVRDGRGLWAKRACRNDAGHVTPHQFAAWQYNVGAPPDQLGDK